MGLEHFLRAKVAHQSLRSAGVQTLASRHVLERLSAIHGGAILRDVMPIPRILPDVAVATAVPSFSFELDPSLHTRS